MRLKARAMHDLMPLRLPPHKRAQTSDVIRAHALRWLSLPRLEWGSKQHLRLSVRFLAKRLRKLFANVDIAVTVSLDGDAIS